MSLIRSSSKPEKPFWVARHATTILFFIIVLSAAGLYLAGKIPISVFPETNFPRVVIGVDNGVIPADQMQAAITNPIESAPHSLPPPPTIRPSTPPASPPPS